jgi:hypothetical protein
MKKKKPVKLETPQEKELREKKEAAQCLHDITAKHADKKYNVFVSDDPNNIPPQI